MAKKYYDGEVTMNTNWGGDESTGNLPVIGSKVQEFIKENLKSKVGYLGTIDGVGQPFYVLTRDKESFEAYKETVTTDNPNGVTTTDGFIGRFNAPFTHELKIELGFTYKSTLIGSTGNSINIKASVVDKSNSMPTNENISITVRVITEGGVETSQTVVYDGFKIANGIEYNLDGKLASGMNSIIVSAIGMSSNISGVQRASYRIVDIYFNDTFEINKKYTINENNYLGINIPYSLKGIGHTVINWYIDGGVMSDDNTKVLPTKTTTISKINPTISNNNETIEFSNTYLSCGVHTLQMQMICIDSSSGEEFKTPIYYREFIIDNVNDSIADKPYIVRKTTLNKDEMIMSGIPNLPIYDAKQYYNTILEYSVFYKGKGSCQVIVSEKYTNETASVISNEIVTLSDSFSDVKRQTINFTKTGNLEIILSALNHSNNGENYVTKYTTNVILSDLNVSFVTDNLILNLNALGRSNDSSDKDKWECTYRKNGKLNKIETTFSKTGYAELFQKPMDSTLGETGNTIKVSVLPEIENKDYKYLLYNEKYYIWEREFDWSNTSGWYNDKLRLSNGNSITINYAPFDDDNFSRNNGATFEFEFETTNVYNDNAVICQICGYNDYAPGITIYASGAELVISREIVEPEYDEEGNQINVNAGYIQSVSTKFKSEENNRISFVITPNNTTESGYRNRLIKIYVNGELCGAYPYESDTNFSNNSYITFRGTSDACVNISSVQIYNNALSSDEILGNYIYLRNSSSEKVEIFKRNDIMSNGSEDSFNKDKLKSQIPIMTFYQIERTDINGNTVIDSLDDIHQETKDKKLTRFFDVVYEDTQHPENNFLIKNAYVTPQGTSSMNYPVKNLRLYTGKKDNNNNYYSRLYVGKNIFKDNNPNNRLTKEEFESISSTTSNIETWNVNEDTEVKDKKRRHPFKTGSAPVNCWCLKADFAESSSSHNTGTARFWNEVLKSNGLLTKAQQKSQKINYKYDVRTTIDGFPIVVFYQELNQESPRFEGKYNFNNDKSTEDVFGFTGGDVVPGQDFKYFYIGEEEPIIGYDKDKNEYGCSYDFSGTFDITSDLIDEDSPLYVLNNDENKGIVGYYMLRGNTHLDNPRMECWEILNSVNDLALFKTIDNFTIGDGNEKVGIITKNDKNEDVFKEAFESRYPDCGDYFHTNFLKKFCTWLVDCRYLDYDRNTGESIYFNDDDFNKIKKDKLTIQSLTKQEKSIKFEQPGARLYNEVKYEDIKDKIYNDHYKEINQTDVTVDEEYILSIEGFEIPSVKQKGEIEDIDGQKIEIEFDYIKLSNNKYYIWTISNLLVTDTLPETHQVSYDFVLVTSDNKYYKWTNMIDLKNYHEPQIFNDTPANRALKFAIEKYDHIEMDKMAAYYIYLMRFGGVDQTVKNAMLTTEGPADIYDENKNVIDNTGSTLPSLWYFINYDNDTILGVKNDGRLVFDPYITRQTKDGTGHVYAGRESTLWNNLEADSDFMEHVNKIDNILTKGEKNKNYSLSYNNAIREYDIEQSDKWCERIYNKDAERKYIDTYVKGWTQSNDKENTHTQVYEDYLYDVHGSRSSHRKWWIGRRFNIFDSKFCNSNFMNYLIKFRSTNLPSGSEFSIKSGEPIYYAWGHDNNITEMTKNVVKPGDTYTFKTNSAFNIGSYLELYGAPNIITLDLRKSAGAITELDITKCYSELVGTKLKELLLGNHTDDSIRNRGSQLKLSGLNIAQKLEVLDMTNVENVTAFDGLNTLLNIKEVYAKGTRVSSLVFAEGAMIEKLTLPTTLKTLELIKCPLINASNIEINNDVYYSLETLRIENCKQLMSNFNFIYNWLSNKTEDKKRNLTLNLIGIDWEFELYDYENFKIFEGIKNKVINGKIKINQELDITHVEKLKSIFGDDCFDKNSALQIIANPKVYITLPNTIWRGTERVEGIITKVGINDVISTDLSFALFNGTNKVLNQTVANVDVSDLENGKFYVTINETKYEYDSIKVSVSVNAKILHDSNEITIIYDESKECLIKERIYPTGFTFIPQSLSLNSYNNTLSLSYESEGTEDLNDVNLEGRGYFTVKWELSGSNFNGRLYFINPDGTTGTTTSGETVTLINDSNNTFEGNINIKVTIKRNYIIDGTGSISKIELFEITSPETILTKKSNEPIYNILKNNGIIKEINGFGKLTKDSASKIKLSDLVINGTSIFSGNSGITSFNEFAYFTHETIGSTTENTLTDGFFKDCVNLTEITFNTKLKYCGNDIFNGCKSLHSIHGYGNTIDGNGTPIKSNVGLVSIMSGFASGCESLTTIGTTNSLSNCTNIGSNAFYNCKNLRNLSIGSNTGAIISHNAFIGCYNIVFSGPTYSLNNTSSKYQIHDGALYEKNNNHLALIHMGRNSKVSNIPDDMEVRAKAYSMEYRNVNADENHKEMEIIVKNNIIFDGNYIFSNSIGNSITLTKKLSEMRSYDSLFYKTRFNWNYKFADNETLIPNSCFNSVPDYTDVYSIPEGVHTLGKEAFYDAKIRKINFPSTIKTIGSNVFWLIDELKEITFNKLEGNSTPPKIDGNDIFFANHVEKIYVHPNDYSNFMSATNNGNAFNLLKPYIIPSHLYNNGYVGIISNGEWFTDPDKVTVGGLPVTIDGEKIGYFKYDTNNQIITNIEVKLEDKVVGIILGETTKIYDDSSDNSSLIESKDGHEYYDFSMGLGSIKNIDTIIGLDNNNWAYDQKFGGIINKDKNNCDLEFKLGKADNENTFSSKISYGFHAYANDNTYGYVYRKDNNSYMIKINKPELNGFNISSALSFYLPPYPNEQTIVKIGYNPASTISTKTGINSFVINSVGIGFKNDPPVTQYSTLLLSEETTPTVKSITVKLYAPVEIPNDVYVTVKEDNDAYVYRKYYNNESLTFIIPNNHNFTVSAIDFTTIEGKKYTLKNPVKVESDLIHLYYECKNGIELKDNILCYYSEYSDWYVNIDRQNGSWGNISLNQVNTEEILSSNANGLSNTLILSTFGDSIFKKSIDFNGFKTGVVGYIPSYIELEMFNEHLSEINSYLISMGKKEINLNNIWISESFDNDNAYNSNGEIISKTNVLGYYIFGKEISSLN